MSQTYLSTLTIHKFRKIIDMQLDFKPGVNMIIGHNGTGKSNILSLITSGSGVGRSVLMPKYENFFQIDKSEDFINYSVINTYTDADSGQKFTENLSFKNDNTDDTRVAHIVPRLKATPTLDNTNAEALERRKNFYNVNSGASAKMPIPTKFISVSRVMPRGEDIVTINSKSLGSDSVLYKDWYNGVLNLSVASDENNAYEVDRQSGQKKVEMRLIDTPASGVSVGQDSLSTIISGLIELYDESQKDNYVGSILAIDEFDMSLHADAQIKLLDKLIQISRDFDVQIFITTHSLSAVKYFHRKVSRHPERHTMTYIKDRMHPHVAMDTSYFGIAQSMYLDTNILAPKINLYTEDRSGLRLLKLIMNAFPDETVNFSNNSIRFIAMKASKSVLKYLNGTDESDADDPHFHSSLIVYDGDGRYQAHSNLEKSAASGKYILGKEPLPVVQNDKIGRNAVILPSGFAPEAYIYHWLHRFTLGRDALSLDFWRHVDAQQAGIESEYYIDIFKFTESEANITNLKDKHMEDLFDFAEKYRLIEFINEVDTTDSDLLNAREQITKFISDLNQARNYVARRLSAQALEL